MRRKEAVTIQIHRRLFELEQAVKIETQTFRERWIVSLDQLFNLAISIANPANRDENLRKITPKEQQMWAQIAVRLGEVMANLSRGFDERQFNEDLAELERQVDEIKKLHTQKYIKDDPNCELG